MTLFQALMAGIVALIVFLPPKYDPAIRLKERNERKRKNEKW